MACYHIDESPVGTELGDAESQSPDVEEQQGTALAGEESPEGDGMEAQERQGCAIEATAELSQKDRVQMRIVQGKCIAGLVITTYLVVYSAYAGYWAVVAAYVTACLVHALIRSVMDWAYDLARLERTLKIRRFFYLAVVNWLQVRAVHEASECLRTGSVGMGLNMTLVVEALLKVVPLFLIDTTNLLLTLTEVEMDSTTRMTVVILLLSCLTKSWSAGNQVLGFELMTNAGGSAPMKGNLRTYFVADVFLRGVSFATISCALASLENIPAAVAFMPFLVSYINRVIIMAVIYISRGFIYQPSPPAVVDSTGAFKKMLFALFPGGFVQAFTDFPFNGDLATKPRIFLTHQIFSVSEAAACMLIAVFPLDFLNLFPGKAVPIVVLVLWSVCAALKVNAFRFYWRARISSLATTSHQAKMTRASAGDAEKRMDQTKSDHSHLLSQAQFIIYVKNHCPGCTVVVQKLRHEKANFWVRNIDDFMGVERADILNMLNEYTPDGAVALPMVWFDGDFIGGVAEALNILETQQDRIIHVHGDPSARGDKDQNGEGSFMEYVGIAADVCGAL